MTSTTIVHPGPSPEEDFDLGAIAHHNASSYLGESKHADYQPAELPNKAGLGISYHDSGYAPVPLLSAYNDFEYQSYLHNPPTPRSNTDSPGTGGVRTRSGRTTSARRTDSPFSSSARSKSRVSKSPAPRGKKPKSSKLDKSKTPKLTAPLSVLTKDCGAPVKDIDAWVNRSAETRAAEVEKRGGYITRPMNSFMLYRSAYADRTKEWCTQNNHQIVSSVAGESWPMEPEEVREQFNDYAKLERANHQAAHPKYKFSPSKIGHKKRKGGEADVSDGESVDMADPDGDYRGGGRHVRPRRHEMEYLPSQPAAFDTTPYYTHQADPYAQQQVAYQAHPPNVAYDQYGTAYDARLYGHVGGLYMAEMARAGTPASQQQQQQQQQVSVGTYGVPGASAQQDFYHDAGPLRAATPLHAFQAQQQYWAQQQFAAQQQALYQQQQFDVYPQPQEQQYDPRLLDELQLAAAGGDLSSMDAGSHFENALSAGGGGDGVQLAQEFFDQSASPDATLAPAWSAGDEAFLA